MEALFKKENVEAKDASVANETITGSAKDEQPSATKPDYDLIHLTNQGIDVLSKALPIVTNAGYNEDAVAISKKIVELVSRL